MKQEEKKKFFDIMYQIMTSTGAITVKDFYGKKIQTIKSFLAKYNDLSETDKEFFVKIWKNIIKVAKLNMENYLPKKKIKEKKKKPQTLMWTLIWRLYEIKNCSVSAENRAFAAGYHDQGASHGARSCRKGCGFCGPARNVQLPLF